MYPTIRSTASWQSLAPTRSFAGSDIENAEPPLAEARILVGSIGRTLNAAKVTDDSSSEIDVVCCVAASSIRRVTSADVADNLEEEVTLSTDVAVTTDGADGRMLFRERLRLKTAAAGKALR